VSHGTGRFVAVLGLLVAGFAPVAAPAQPIEQTVEDHRDDIGEIDRRGNSFVHRASGYVFPAMLGEVPARKTITFGPGDAEVYYTLYGGANDDAWISLYVYKANLGLAEVQRGVEQVIVENYAATAVARPSIIAAPPAGVGEGWFKAQIQGIAVITGARVAQASGWTIKVRVSVPVRGGDAALGRAARALAAIPMAPVGMAPPPAAPASHASAAAR